ncbi:ADP-ribosylglycohydrolase family protein [Mesorhizobium sp. L2C084A000]|uniref:ADP-ribosylglycohydrolase family protein n=1 Tax=Mesorhizobium sp. L2C084A000 TaxID=1287116 RepID=UPI0003D05C96|nr:ADP-ribosylglycohydrolase family protein [Mesorhizobium sp. L2C084A000]ESZ25680.1 hypothetical protein X734_18070 [Mesorhizobium sp. L2C084A000]
MVKEANLQASYRNDEYERAIINSSLWAAAGDALGWITELSRGQEGVRYRTGKKHVTAPVAWQRTIGGRGGVRVDLPAGTYSDDTQLRLSVSRSIRGNGTFDVETFAKIEVTAWQGYSLGAGLGSKAAAANLSKRGINWFSNFFRSERQSYTNGGGNGAAMRIQPHVWGAAGAQPEMIRQVFRDAIVTHGHPHGFCGAVFHALCLWDTLASRSVPSIKRARDLISLLDDLSGIVEQDAELGQFWLPSWEREANKSFPIAIRDFQKDALADMRIADDIAASRTAQAYPMLLDRIGCLSDKFRGSGFKTALAALALSALYADRPVEDALAVSANELESDTDTIATMAGALMGAVTDRPPAWEIQDRGYLEKEARRLARIRLGQDQSTFLYPDVSLWEPPASQSDAVVRYNGGLALVGLGPLTPRSREYQAGNAVWQWFELPFGQTILAKRRVENTTLVGGDQMPGQSRMSTRPAARSDMDTRQDSFTFDHRNAPDSRGRLLSASTSAPSKGFPGIDEATDMVIASGFDDATLGRLIKQCIDETGSIDLTVSLSAIIAKARLARMRRR